jgi:ABC-type amino acid transport substrate-binding protein
LLRLFALATISVLGLLLLLNHQRLFTRPDLTWLAMQERGTWRVGMDPSFPPFETLDEQGRPVGFDVALAERMAAAWGLELEIVPIGYDSLLDALQTGQIDSVVSALPYDPRITQDVAFSPPYFEAGVRLAVRAGSSLADLSITESDEFVAQLAGLRIAVEWGSVSDGVGRRLQRAEPSIELAPHPTPHDAAQALLDDPSIDALLIDNVSLRQKQGEGAALVAVGPALEGNPYVIAAPFTARTLQQEIADTLQRLQESGEMDKIEREWFGAVP